MKAKCKKCVNLIRIEREWCICYVYCKKFIDTCVLHIPIVKPKICAYFSEIKLSND